MTAIGSRKNQQEYNSFYEGLGAVDLAGGDVALADLGADSEMRV